MYEIHGGTPAAAVTALHLSIVPGGLERLWASPTKSHAGDGDECSLQVAVVRLGIFSAFAGDLSMNDERTTMNDKSGLRTAICVYLIMTME